jgi:hypothetical protein
MSMVALIGGATVTVDRWRVVERVCRAEVRSHRDVIYIYEDSIFGAGSGPQAREIRGEGNGVGVAVRKCPGHGEQSFLSDEDLPANRAAIDRGLDIVESALRMGRSVAIPRGFGRELSQRAPLTARYLGERLEELRVLAAR